MNSQQIRKPIFYISGILLCHLFPSAG